LVQSSNPQDLLALGELEHVEITRLGFSDHLLTALDALGTGFEGIGDVGGADEGICC
jgi:hypothetical protein